MKLIPRWVQTKLLEIVLAISILTMLGMSYQKVYQWGIDYGKAQCYSNNPKRK
jgi:hypothetical protein